MPRRRVIPTVRVVHVCPPILVHTDLSNFQAVVQELTGKRQMASMESVADLADCHVCNHHDQCGMRATNEPDILEGRLKGAENSNNQFCFNDDCLSTDDVNDVDGDSCARDGFLIPTDDGCLSPNCSTNSTSSNNSFIYNEVTSAGRSLINNMAPNGGMSEEIIACISTPPLMRPDMSKLVTSEGEYVAHQLACSDGSQPSKRAKPTNENNYHDPEARFTYLCNSMEHIFSQHAEESTVISGFITPPIFSLNDEQLIAEYGDHDLLQDLYDMEIFPLSSACSLPG
ncbi:hypothetical protein GOP47_0026034 [Adiantum capillus-veneris]|uniref:VQ domain-containing protein n=1 Tax=Adiantum capillus-veneris TaxID=13818 RepID=A0A9D4U2F9_ADICA|nr:hypothetical protein GOP47_0026034 [Adiantum capillus-veneris]